MGFASMRKGLLTQVRQRGAGMLLAAMLGLPMLAMAQEAPPGGPPAPTKSMLGVFHDGGPLMYPIALCSFALMVFSFERLVALRRGRVIPGPFVKRFLEQLREGQLDRDKAIKLCEENKSPIARVFAGAAK